MKISVRLLLPTLCMMIITTLVLGTVFAAEYNLVYYASSLDGGANEKDWSPTRGTYSGDVDVHYHGVTAMTYATGVAWGRTNAEWINNQFDWYRNTTGPTFHSFRRDNRCSSFQVLSNVPQTKSDIPNVLVEKKKRQCVSEPTEIRFKAGSHIVANKDYYAQAIFSSHASMDGQEQKFTVDTYYIGDENHHGTFCTRSDNTNAYECQ